MFWVYYWVVAVFSFWAIATHRNTRGKPFVALFGALTVPFALPLIPVFGLIAWAYTKLKS